MNKNEINKDSETQINELDQTNEQKQVNVDFRELVVSLIIEVEVLKECLVKNRLITSEDYIKNVNLMRKKREIIFSPKTS